MEKREPKRKIQRENEQAAPVEAPIDPATGFPWPKMTIDRAGGNVLVGTTVTPFPAKSLTWIELLNFAEHPGQTLTSGQIEHVAAINHSLGTPGATLVSTLRGRFGEKADSFLLATVKEPNQQGQIKPVGFRLQVVPEFVKPRAFRAAIREAKVQAAYLTEPLTPESEISRLEMAAVGPTLTSNLYKGIKDEHRRATELASGELINEAKDFLYGKQIAQVREQALWKLARFAVADTDYLRNAIAQIPDIRVKTLLFRLVLGPERNILLQDKIDQIMAANALADAAKAAHETRTAQVIFEDTEKETQEIKPSVFDQVTIATLLGYETVELQERISSDPEIAAAYQRLRAQLQDRSITMNAEAQLFAFDEFLRGRSAMQKQDEEFVPESDQDKIADWLATKEFPFLFQRFAELYHSKEAREFAIHRTWLAQQYEALRHEWNDTLSEDQKEAHVLPISRQTKTTHAAPRVAVGKPAERSQRRIREQWPDILSDLDTLIGTVSGVMKADDLWIGAQITGHFKKYGFAGGWSNYATKYFADQGIIKQTSFDRRSRNPHPTYNREDVIMMRAFEISPIKLEGQNALIRQLRQIVRQKLRAIETEQDTQQ